MIKKPPLNQKLGFVITPLLPSQFDIRQAENNDFLSEKEKAIPKDKLSLVYTIKADFFNPSQTIEQGEKTIFLTNPTIQSLLYGVLGKKLNLGSVFGRITLVTNGKSFALHYYPFGTPSFKPKDFLKGKGIASLFELKILQDFARRNKGQFKSYIKNNSSLSQERKNQLLERYGAIDEYSGVFQDARTLEQEIAILRDFIRSKRAQRVYAEIKSGKRITPNNQRALDSLGKAMRRTRLRK